MPDNDQSVEPRGNTSENTPPKQQLPPAMEAAKWKPGQSGNPSGRPKKKWLTEVVEELLEEKLANPEFREIYKEKMWTKLLDKGVVSAMTLDKVWERTEGKVAQSVELSGNLTIAERMSKAEKRLASNQDVDNGNE